jgi:gluconolactonase
MGILRVGYVLLAVVVFFAYAGRAEGVKTVGSIERVDAGLDALLDGDAVMEVLAEEHEWTEGPVWVEDGGYVLFSDIPRNQILKWKEGEGESVYMEPSGYTGEEPFTGSEPGTNGLMLDAAGRLVMCCHGDRLIRRQEKNGELTVLADKHDGKRFNSPNDLVYHSNGDMYFTDPPYGLPKRYNDPAREKDYCGVYRLTADGEVSVQVKGIPRPNGIAMSPDEKILYVGQSNAEAANWHAYDVGADGNLSNERVFFDDTATVGKLKGVPDGMVVDADGNVWATGPGGVLIISPEGKLLGRLLTGEATANCTFGEDGSTLFITADMYLLRIKTKTKGQGF